MLLTLFDLSAALGGLDKVLTAIIRDPKKDRDSKGFTLADIRNYMYVGMLP